MKARPPDLTIAIVSYRDLCELRNCLRSIENFRPSRPFEVWVVDNDPCHDAASAVKREFPWVRIIQNQENVGFSCANNQVLRASSAQYALLLNSDTEVLPGSLDVLCAFLDGHPKVSVVGPQLLNSDGSLQPSGHRLRTRFEEIWWLLPIYRWLGRKLSDRFRQPHRDYSREAEVEEISGAAMLVRRAALEEVGFLDEDLFFSYEDVELCVRARAGGWQVYYLPQAQVIHHWGRSTSRAGGMIRLRALRSQLTFYRKVYGSPFSLLIRAIICLRSAVAIALLTPSLLGQRREVADKIRERIEEMRICLKF
jgi:hypothetical protein